MRLHVLVEGPSEAALLRPWLGRFLPAHVSAKVYVHEGKGKLPGDPARKPDPRQNQLLHQLPAKLRGFGKSLDPEAQRVVVLVDADDDDRNHLQDRLEGLLAYCTPPPTAVFCIAVEELEAFYLGDWPALRSAFSRPNRHRYYQYAQDSICGTWEVFRDVVRWKTDDKVTWARKMSATLGTQYEGINANRSPSFTAFCRDLLTIAGVPTV